ncbi:sulfur carrier protein ThiS [Siphonobacter aquaeclarae]|uniref:Sulfur carrier protein n=1 Tax=Siphonobacter aquaeclarae TaxID=563176 RepID=A0A1G9SSN5_9BACT|nr:sulfur carrier protein ThiS [Siphonobacter aquaeclarae]SDM38423.1 sulfur carrier protein [Siphonobacter aquaeclarae]
MTVFVNQQPIEEADAATLLQLLTRLSLSDKKGIAVAVDAAVVPRAFWGTTPLTANQKITILQATQGG